MSGMQSTAQREVFAMKQHLIGTRAGRARLLVHSLIAFAAIATLGAFFLLQSAGTTISRQELLPIGLIVWLEIALVLVGVAIALRRQPL